MVREHDVNNIVTTMMGYNYFGINLLERGWKNGGLANSVSFMGMCRYKDSKGIIKDIRISKTFLQYVSLWEVINTTLHEIAHALDYEQRGTSDHGRIWADLAREIGCNPDYRVNINKLAADDAENFYRRNFKYSLVCPTHGTKFGVTKKLRRSYLCDECRAILQPRQNR